MIALNLLIDVSQYVPKLPFNIDDYAIPVFAILLILFLISAVFGPREERHHSELQVAGILLGFTFIAILSLLASTHRTVAFEGGVALAVLLFLWRLRLRALYGIGEILFGLYVLWDAASKGRGESGTTLSADIVRFQLSEAWLQTFAAVYVLVRGLDNFTQGMPEKARKAFEARVKQWRT